MANADDWLRAVAGGVEIEVVVVPRSSRSAIAGLHDGRVKVQLNAPPVDGEANAELISLVAKLLGVRKSDVAIVSGERGKRKRLLIRGADERAVRAAIV